MVRRFHPTVPPRGWQRGGRWVPCVRADTISRHGLGARCRSTTSHPKIEERRSLALLLVQSLVESDEASKGVMAAIPGLQHPEMLLDSQQFAFRIHLRSPLSLRIDVPYDWSWYRISRVWWLEGSEERKENGGREDGRRGCDRGSGGCGGDLLDPEQDPVGGAFGGLTCSLRYRLIEAIPR